MGENEMSIFMVNKMEHNKIKVQSLTDKTISLKPKINKYILYDKVQSLTDKTISLKPKINKYILYDKVQSLTDKTI
jgi:hypothetical protein